MGFWNLLELVAQRPVFITAAIVGAIMATAGSIIMGKSGKSALGRVLLWLGYGLTGFSILVFIVAGYLA